MASQTRNRRKPSQRTANGQRTPLAAAQPENGRTPKLSRANIAELAQQMQIPEGMLQMVLQRYPELGKPLARRWVLTARKDAA
jgi:hypothetical protein